MTEIEIKFQVPPARREALARAVATATSSRVRLRAQYFDTADRRLAQAGLALRVRKEGRRWVQTLKGAGDGIWQRLEHELVLTLPPGAEPVADLSLHDGNPAGEALRQALGDGELLPTYGTDVMRTKRLLRAPGCLVELAFDVGGLTAGDARWPLCEMEFELKSGDALALAALASRWAARFGLTLDIRSKAERGDRLARGVRLGAPVKARPLLLPEGVHSDAALRAVAGNCLMQVLGNASDITHESDTEPEQLHQLRVGLRRLRTAVRELGTLSPQLRAEWGDALAQLFGRLGSARDRDALAQTLLPALRKAGASGLELPQIEPEPAAQAALRETATTQLWLELMAFAAGGGRAEQVKRVEQADQAEQPEQVDQAGQAEQGAQAFEPQARKRLGKLFRAVRRDAARFDTLDDVARHSLRKRVKRLRYLSDFCSSLFKPKDVRRFLKCLTPAQEALGDFNDVCVARTLFEPAGFDDSMAMFALGWLAHERDDTIARCVRALAALRKATPFW